MLMKRYVNGKSFQTPKITQKNNSVFNITEIQEEGSPT